MYIYRTHSDLPCQTNGIFGLTSQIIIDYILFGTSTGLYYIGLENISWQRCVVSVYQFVLRTRYRGNGAGWNRLVKIFQSNSRAQSRLHSNGKLKKVWKKNKFGLSPSPLYISYLRKTGGTYRSIDLYHVHFPSRRHRLEIFLFQKEPCYTNPNR